jgi:DNA-binding XRE family transcriptional regulator
MPARRQELVRRRKMVGFSQERLAEAVGVDRSTVVRWERAETEPQPWHRPRLAAALEITVEELAELLEPSPHRHIPPAPAPVNLTCAGAAPATSGDHFDIVQSFRTADRQVGGAHLYAAVTSYLHRTVAPRVFGHAPDRGGQRIFATAASLIEMAGWMAHDCGHDRLAWRHFERASGMALAGRDYQLAAHVFGSLSHLAHHLRQPQRAVAYARRGQEHLTLSDRHPGLEARLLALRARGHAATGDSASCLVDLGRAERVLASSPTKVASPWVSSYDAASLAVDTARCLYRIGQLGAARTQVEQVMNSGRRNEYAVGPWHS